MFYSQFILAKKGPLGTIWIAAHLERKLRKNQVADTDIGVSVDSILFPEMPIALRLSSHLLLGVVRIYSKKVNYLFDDCSEALLKVKQAFRSTAVDLPPEESTAPYHSITLPETFDLDDFELPDSELFQSNYDHHISSKDQITLQDTMEGVVYSTSKFGLDERFGDGDASGLDLDEELLIEKAVTAELATGTSNSDVDPQASVQANESLKYDDHRKSLTDPEGMPTSGIVIQHIEEYDGDNEPVEYAQAPCTPGLWEEPNLSNNQDTSACDDHQEPENHSIAEFAVKVNSENVSSKEDECVPHEQHHNQFEPHIGATEGMMAELGSKPFTESFLPDHVRSKSPIAEVSETAIAVPDDPVKVEDLLDKNGRDEESTVQTVDDNHENSIERQGNQENACHLTTELELNTESSGKYQDQAALEPNKSTVPFQYPQDGMPSSDFPTIRPCVTLLNHESNGEGPQATEALERNFQGTHIAGLHSNDEVQAVSSISNRQLDNSIDGEAQVNINNYPSEFPAPEKLLSFPQGISDVPKNFVPESTPVEKDIATGDGGDAWSNRLSGKKRSFIESSLTTQSLDLNDASGLYTANMHGESILDDDDLLSSILVGRKSSILKMKPTPPVEVPSTKRRRSAPKTGISKRKVLMDDNMVLHGDTIRQQLTNTEDIRRLRKKAPCTHSEISMIEKQFWEDELFSEAIFTGLSIKMVSLHNQSYDPSKIKIVVSHSDIEGGTDLKLISQNDDKDMQLEVEDENLGVSVEPNVIKENEGNDNFNPVSGKNVSDVEPTDFPLVTDSHTFDINIASLDHYGSPTQLHAIRDVAAEPFSSEHEILGHGAERDIAEKTFSDADTGVFTIPVEVESLTRANMVLSDTYDMSALPGEAMDVSLQTNASGVHSNENMVLPAVDMDIRSNGPIESSVASEIKTDVTSVTEISEKQHELVANESSTFSSELDGLKAHIGTLDQDVQMRNNGICGEEFVSAAAYDAEVNPVWEDDPLGDRENAGHQVTYPTTAMDAEDITANNRFDDEEFTYSAVGNDTDFLNFDDDDDEVEAAGDYMPDAGSTRVVDNSGWSSRTKAVAKYLQIMFDKEGERGRTMLPVNNLLAGKTRKEASRMFFETLVLKTKDYIHIEQAEPYDNIIVFPRAKLLKADFQ